jgi:hypothetical protein
MSAAPEGYLGLAEAADLAARLDPAAQGRGRVVVTHAVRSGRVEVVEVVDGELVLISSAELANAELEFASGRMKRAGELGRPTIRSLPDGTIDATAISVAVFVGNYDTTQPGDVSPSEPPYEPPEPPREVPALLPAAPDHNNFQPGVTALGGPPADRFANIVTYTQGGETFIDAEATRALQTEAERASSYARSGRPTPADQARAAWIAGLSEEARREQMEVAAGSTSYQPARPAPAAGAYGDAWGPVIFLWQPDLARFVKPQPAAGAAPEIAGPAPANRGRPRGRRAVHDWPGMRIWVLRYVYANGLPEKSSRLVEIIAAEFHRRSDDPPEIRTIERWLLPSIWQELQDIAGPG